MAKQKSPERRLAESIAAQKGIKTKSAMRYLQRASATGDKQKIKKPKFAGLKPSTAKRTKKFVKEIKVAKERKLADLEKQKNLLEKQIDRIAKEIYPRDVIGRAEISCPDKANPLADSRKRGKMVSVTATFEISKDKSTRKLRLYCTPEEIEEIKSAGSLFDAVGTWTNVDDGEFLSAARISNISKVEIE